MECRSGPLLKLGQGAKAFKAAERYSWGCLRALRLRLPPSFPGLIEVLIRGCFGDYSRSPAASMASSGLAYISILIPCPSRSVHTWAKRISTGIPEAVERPR